MSERVALGRTEVLVTDDDCVLVLEFVHRSDDVTVWFGHRTLAVMARDAFATWLREGGDLVVDDLLWSTHQGRSLLTIDGHRTYILDEATVTRLVHRT